MVDAGPQPAGVRGARVNGFESNGQGPLQSPRFGMLPRNSNTAPLQASSCTQTVAASQSALAPNEGDRLPLSVQLCQHLGLRGLLALELLRDSLSNTSSHAR